MDSILANYDAERMAEFGDEGDPREPKVISCAGCDEEVVERPGDRCGYCTEEQNDIAALTFLQRVAAGVELGCALYALQRAAKHINGGQYQPVTLRSVAIEVLTTEAA